MLKATACHERSDGRSGGANIREPFLLGHNREASLTRHLALALRPNSTRWRMASETFAFGVYLCAPSFNGGSHHASDDMKVAQPGCGHKSNDTGNVVRPVATAEQPHH